jgi:hypothetical protein
VVFRSRINSGVFLKLAAAAATGAIADWFHTFLIVAKSDPYSCNYIWKSLIVLRICCSRFTSDSTHFPFLKSHSAENGWISC